MKLVNKSSKVEENFSREDIFEFSEMENVLMLKSFIKLLQERYGKIEDIIAKNYDENNEICFFERYDSFKEFSEKFGQEHFSNSKLYSFSCIDKGINFKIDIINKLFRIYQYKLDKNFNDESEKSYTYYKFSDGLIIRYDNISSTCYYLDESGNWKYNNSLITYIDDPAYDFELIDNPLEEKKKR